MKYVIGILVILTAIFILGGLGAVTDGVKDFRTDWVADSYVLTTNTTTSNGTVQLVKPLWEGQISEATISSNLSTDTPALTGYTVASKNLVFNGLTTNTSRLITVEYRTFGLQNYPGADTGVKLAPTALIIGAVFLPLLAIVMILLGR
jgi:hypothetical protein